MRRLAAVTAVAAIVVALSVDAAYAPMAPQSCGRITVRSKHYTVKKHLVRCRGAKRLASRYMRTGRRPRGWSCRRFSPRQTRIRMRCVRGSRLVFAIRR